MVAQRNTIWFQRQSIHVHQMLPRRQPFPVSCLVSFLLASGLSCTHAPPPPLQPRHQVSRVCEHMCAAGWALRLASKNKQRQRVCTCMHARMAGDASDAPKHPPTCICLCPHPLPPLASGARAWSMHGAYLLCGSSSVAGCSAHLRLGDCPPP